MVCGERDGSINPCLTAYNDRGACGLELCGLLLACCLGDRFSDEADCRDARCTHMGGVLSYGAGPRSTQLDRF